MSVHDLIIAGEFRKALLVREELVGSDPSGEHNLEQEEQEEQEFTETFIQEIQSENKEESDSTTMRISQERERHGKRDEIMRLPLFLRLLSACQPLASVPSIGQKKTVELEVNSSPTESGTAIISDQEIESEDQKNLDDLVSLLERVAASFPAAEDVDVLTSYLAPEVCRSVSKCKPLTRKQGTLYRLPPSDDVVSGSASGSEESISETTTSTTTSINNTSTIATATTSTASPSENYNHHHPHVAIDGILASHGMFIISGWKVNSLANLYQTSKALKSSTVSSQNKKIRSSSPSPGMGTTEMDIEQDEDNEDEDNVNEIIEGMDTNDQSKMQSEAIASVTGNEDVTDIIAKNRMLAALLPTSSADNSKSKKRKHNFDNLQESGNSASSDSRYAVATAEDSQESSVARTLMEVVELTLASLEDIQVETKAKTKTNYEASPTRGYDEDDRVKDSSNKEQSMQNRNDDERSRDNTAVSSSVNPNPITTAHESYSKRGITIKIKPDSLLSEPTASGAKIISSSTSQVIQELDYNINASSDLSATIPSLLYHAPVLQHRHLANALCRACVPQTAEILRRSVANCPVASQAVVRGCIDAYQGAKVDNMALMEEGYTAIQTYAMDSVKAIASLSDRETAYAIFALNQSKIMPCVILDLMMMKNNTDRCSTVAVLMEDLIKYLKKLAMRSDTSSGTNDHGVTKESIMKPRRGCRKTHRRPIRRKYKTFLSNPPSQESWIVQTLIENEKLSEKVINFLSSNISLISSNEDRLFVWGKVVFYVRTYALMIYCIGIGANGFTDAEKMMILLSSMMDKCNNEQSDTTTIDGKSKGGLHPIEKHLDFIMAAMCASILTAVKFNSSLPQSAPTSTASTKVLTRIFEHCGSDSITKFQDNLMQCILKADALRLRSLVLSALISHEHDDNILFSSSLRSSKSLEEQEHERFGSFCQWVSSQLKLTEFRDPISVPFILMQASEAPDKFDSKLIVPNLLASAEKSSVVYGDELIASYLKTSIEQMCKKKEPIIPLVMPLKLESLATKAFYQQNNSNSESGIKIRRQLELQLIYALLFKEKMPESPFVIDPRSLPLDQILHLIDRDSVNPTGTFLTKLILRHCPEYLDFSSMIVPLQHFSLASKITPHILGNALRACIEDKYDAEGIKAEQLFSHARSSLPFSVVDHEAAKALLTSVQYTSLQMSYTAFCRDPLLLLKCSVKVWKCHGLRRIMLSILQRFLESNEILILESATDKKAASEYLAARDTVLLRCCLIIGSGAFVPQSKHCLDSGRMFCPMLISMARFLVKKRQGLVAAVVRQGLPGAAVDWLTDFVPESVTDAKILTSILEKRELTATRNLGAADASLRIAIHHGSQNENVSQPLAYAALALLVSSFFLVVGPVGVPVNITCEDGKDITLSCRTSMFRMLSALQSIRGNRQGLKNEARLALTKLANLCKSDVGAGTAAKNKKLLKEIWDAVSRAINALGGGVQV